MNSEEIIREIEKMYQKAEEEHRANPEDAYEWGKRDALQDVVHVVGGSISRKVQE